MIATSMIDGPGDFSFWAYLPEPGFFAALILLCLVLSVTGLIFNILSALHMTIVMSLMAVALGIEFHAYLPLPPEVDREIIALKARLWPW